MQPITYALSPLGRLRQAVETLVLGKSISQWNSHQCSLETQAVLVSGHRILNLPHDQTSLSHRGGS